MVIDGTVVQGKKIGRKLGFPTANISAAGKVHLPKFGVYLCFLHTKEDAYPSIANIGRHPTLPEGHITIEVHMLDASRDLYGQDVRVELLEYLRPEQRFDSIDALKEQIGRDAETAKNYFEHRIQEGVRAQW